MTDHPPPSRLKFEVHLAAATERKLDVAKIKRIAFEEWKARVQEARRKRREEGK